MDQSALSALLGFLAGLSPTTMLIMLGMVVLSPFGVLILVLIFNHFNERRRAAELAAYREDSRITLETYRADLDRTMDEYGETIQALASYYRDNVKLVEAYEKTAQDLHTTVVLNTQTMQKLVDAVCTNQFCPGTRPNKGHSPMKGAI